jgi:hypothetical protein
VARLPCQAKELSYSEGPSAPRTNLQTPLLRVGVLSCAGFPGSWPGFHLGPAPAPDWFPPGRSPLATDPAAGPVGEGPGVGPACQFLQAGLLGNTGVPLGSGQEIVVDSQWVQASSLTGIHTPSPRVVQAPRSPEPHVGARL